MRLTDNNSCKPRAQRAVLAFAVIGALAGRAEAAPTAGTFNITGNLTASTNGITWQNIITPFTADQATIGAVSGDFAGLGGSNVTIDDITYSTEPIGTAFVATNFLNSFTNPGLPDLELTKIFAGSDGAAGCATTPPAAGQNCTPLIGGNPSPFNFLNTTSDMTTLTFDVSGITSDGLSTWNGIFTSQFNGEPFQTVLADFDTTGFSNAYSGTITVTANAVTGVPEPLTLSLFGAGLVGAAAMRRRKTK